MSSPAKAGKASKIMTKPVKKKSKSTSGLARSRSRCSQYLRLVSYDVQARSDGEVLQLAGKESGGYCNLPRAPPCQSCHQHDSQVWTIFSRNSHLIMCALGINLLFLITTCLSGRRQFLHVVALCHGVQCRRCTATTSWEVTISTWLPLTLCLGLSSSASSSN